MKSLQIAGLCFVAMFVIGMATAVTSSAVEWLHCTTLGVENVTKYEDNNCSDAKPGGVYGWREITTTESIVDDVSLTLSDTKVPIVGTVTVNCTAKGSGGVGFGNKDSETEITEISCTPGKNCESITKETKPVHLGWGSELVEESGKITDDIISGGSGAPGWDVTCKVLGIEKTDECTSEKEVLPVENKFVGVRQYALGD